MSSDSSNNTNNDSIINIGKEDESSVKKRVSPVYQYFTFNDELSRWYCDYCAKDFGDNTSNLWRHIKKIHSEILGESEKTNSNNNEKPTQHGFRKKLLQWVVRDDQPFITIECQEFKNMVKYLWPSVNVPSANTLRRDLSANFEQVKDKVRLELQWELQSLTLDFCLLSGQHSRENLAQQFLKVLEDFNIETKLLAIGCDNASNMDVMLNKISSSLRSKNISFNPNNQRVRCFAHIINLAAKKAVENLYISDLNDDDNLDIRETTNELMINESIKRIVPEHVVSIEFTNNQFSDLFGAVTSGEYGDREVEVFIRREKSESWKKVDNGLKGNLEMLEVLKYSQVKFCLIEKTHLDTPQITNTLNAFDILMNNSYQTLLPQHCTEYNDCNKLYNEIIDLFRNQNVGWTGGVHDTIGKAFVNRIMNAICQPWANNDVWNQVIPATLSLIEILKKYAGYLTITTTNMNILHHSDGSARNPENDCTMYRIIACKNENLNDIYSQLNYVLLEKQMYEYIDIKQYLPIDIMK
ncbi:unnamed protein product [Rhizophagus irregularis]|nr:unnamed protein product [Rhizophagus irregularis]